MSAARGHDSAGPCANWKRLVALDRVQHSGHRHSLAADAGAAGLKLLPMGAGEGRTDSGLSNYGGPCPPAGDARHHYEITVYAVKIAKYLLMKPPQAPGSASTCILMRWRRRRW